MFAQLAEVVDGVADGFNVAIFAYGQARAAGSVLIDDLHRARALSSKGGAEGTSVTAQGATRT